MTLRKPAVVSKPLNDLILNRWSPRSFSEKLVDNDILVALFEAARWAASCNNLQPWRYILATKSDPDAWEKAQNCALDRNQRWTRTAPVIGYVLSEPVPLPGGTENIWHRFDTGMASAQLTLEAESRGLVVHHFAGLDYDQTRKTYKIPEKIEIICGLVLGYQGKPEDLMDDLPERETQPRTRKDLGDFIYKGAYGKSAPELIPPG